jgi:hypothetical protein
MRWPRLLMLVGFILTALAAPAAAQGPRGRLLVTVADTTGAVIPNAKVTVVGLEDATKTPAIPPVQTSADGTATMGGLLQGRYTIVAEFAGFDVAYLRDVRVRAGDNKHIVILKVQGFQESVTVGQDTQAAAADRRNSAFGTKLSQEQIDALSEDPDEMSRQIQDLAGTGATIRVDSFEGVQLPPKAQIKSIHVTRDQFAAETEVPGSIFVDVITQPGIGPIRGQANLSFHDASMSARNLFAPTKGAEEVRSFGGNIGGALVPQKSNFSLSVNGQNQYSMPNLHAAQPNGTRSEVLNLRQPSEYTNINGLVDYALTRDQTLRFGYTQQRYVGRNQGIGGYDELERAFSYLYNSYSFRLQEAGPLGRRTFINSRMVVGGTNNGDHSAIEAPTIIVQDAFNSGGAQQAGGTHTRTFTLASDVDYVRGIHSWRTGVQVVGGWSRSDINYNYLGTYTFNSLDDYLAGQPAIYTKQVGNPLVKYFNAQTGIYFQDDVRVRKGLTLSPGVRYSAQTHVSDTKAFEPRLGVTWAPFANGNTTLRASGGIFHGWLQTYAYEQTLRLDGTHQREVIVQNPAYPDPDLGSGIEPPTNKYLLNNFGLQQNVRYSGGIDQTFSPKFRASVLFNYFHQRQLPRGVNLNPPVDGVRPDPAFANVIEVVTDGQIIRHELYVNANLNLAPGPPSRVRFNWRRLTLAANYSYIRAKRNSMGPFDPPPTGDLEKEWGNGPADNPYRINLSLNSAQVRNLTVSLALNASAGQLYNWTTGTDDNHDGIINDRPAGVGIFTLRGTPQRTINTRWAYALTPGSAPGSAPGAIRYRVSLFANVTNLTNHANLAGFSGNMKSQFFMIPTFALNPRRVDVGMNVSF